MSLDQTLFTKTTRGAVRSILTAHARARMDQRAITPEAISAAINYGREVHTRGAVVLALGRKEVREARRKALRLEAFVGTHVVCSHDGHVITAYKSHNMKSLRKNRWAPPGVRKRKPRIAPTQN